MKLCKDCRHHHSRMCFRSWHTEVSLLGGGFSCDVERHSSASPIQCGPKGQFWEPKTEPKTDKPTIWGILSKYKLWGTR